MTPPLDRRARVFGPLIVTTVNQSVGAPRIDGARVTDAEGRSYGALVFGAGVRAPVVGWRGAAVPYPRRWTLRFRAAAHEVRCAECRVTWSSWAARLVTPYRLARHRLSGGGARRGA